MNFLRKLISKHPVATAIVPIIISLLLGLGIFKVKIKDDIVSMLPKNMPSRVALLDLEKTFGASDFIGITIGQETKTVYNKETLEKLKRITEKLMAVPYIDRVKSLANATRIIGIDGGLEILPVMENVPATSEEFKKLEVSVTGDKNIVGTFVSKDKKFLSVFVFLTYTHVDSDVIYNTVKDIITPEIGPEEIHINGVPVIAGIIGRSIRKDLLILVPLVILILTCILYLGLRQIEGVLLTLLVVILSVLPPVGIMGLLGRPMMVISSAMPVILLALACAYSIHVIMKFYHHVAAGLSRKKAATHAIDELFVPIAAAALTTILGFLSMVTSTLTVLFEMGLFSSLGIFWAWILSITMLPALLTLLPVPKGLAEKTSSHKGIFHNVADAVAGFTVKNKRLIIVFYIITTLVFIWGITRLRIESSIDRFFDKNSEVRLANRISNEHFGGSANMSILISGNIKDPAVLKEMISLENYLKSINGIGSASSIADIVCAINQAINDNDPKYKIIPPTTEAVSQALLLYSMSGDPEDLKMFINSDCDAAHMNVRMESMYSRDVKKIVDKVNEFIPKHFPKGVTYSITGSSVFTMELSHMTAISSIWSIITSLIAVLIVGIVLFRSVPFGLLSIVPLSVTMVIIFGFMGLAGIDFSIEIAIIISIVIGVGIDYAEHYIARYCLAENTMSLEAATFSSISNVGPAVLSNAVSISLGFLVLVMSFLMPLRLLGLLVSISMLLAVLATITLLAAILCIYKPEIKHKIRIFEDEEE